MSTREDVSNTVENNHIHKVISPRDRVIFVQETEAMGPLQLGSRDHNFPKNLLTSVGIEPKTSSSCEPGNRAGSVTGMNSTVCSYGKFQPGRPG